MYPYFPIKTYYQSDYDWCWAHSISSLLSAYNLNVKPYQIAATLNKSPDEGTSPNNTSEINEYLEANYPITGVDSWEEGSIIWNLGINNAKNIIINKLNLGKPLYLQRRNINNAVEWIDSDWTLVDVDIRFVCANQASASSDSILSLDIHPHSYDLFTMNGLNYWDLVINWDGKETYNGYYWDTYYKENYRRKENSLGSCFMRSENLWTQPHIANCARKPMNVKIKVQIQNSVGAIIRQKEMVDGISIDAFTTTQFSHDDIADLVLKFDDLSNGE